MSSIPTEFQELFEKPVFAYFATLTPDGLPHVTPVWVDYDADEDRVLVNTERGRRKERNVRENPKVGMGMTDPDDRYRALSVLGEVDEVTEDGAREHIDDLSRRYTGEEYQPEIRTARVLLKIRPDEVIAHGGD
ncbi:PPOX class putative F420-dependent enzyme [Haladaptatus paucihalophilus DX253]|uniref:PPOX class probable F420-dependent enzyme n=1 Tax=Haladaptatus paucihalophilus DX253 TaxID=797209 RepID=E7QRU0_HALPU|nr:MULTISPECIES: TIGR03618 family F420-dependent PPOX class oxidoreductase [Haladaptatus]EFW92709.1 PPOX class putative F420-dependent enzyme [Haladaptatus paucihalophilus DX253]GKZ13693.1 PPOX class F420-dependent enzyme [Haladaptatus sp. T7]SHK15005.1 PPOX class probable F420-dependent enzyme [Haladaptatus paucihalophilus DX253]